MMRHLGPVLSKLRVGRVRDWYRFRWACFRSAGTIRAASLPYIDPGFRLRIKKDATLELGHDVKFFGNFSAYIEGSAVVRVGDRTIFNVGCWLGAIEGLEIGADCLFAPMVTVTDGNHRFGQSDVPFSRQGFEGRHVVIGDNVWLGAKATVINSVGSDTVIGANAVVTKPVPPGSVVVGVPGRVVAQVPPQVEG